MKKILLDENLPVALRHLLAEFQVVTVQFQGWSGKQNGELISLIDGRFDVFLTGDKNLRYQQRIETRQISIIELPFTRLQSLEPYLDQIRAAIRNSVVGDYIQIE
ncbi:MAG: hypothetical protein ACRDBP_03205 [Luteolibacter sp.]